MELDRRRKPARDKTPFTLKQEAWWRKKTRVSPRIRMATRLYVTGTVPTMEQAASAAGLHPAYFGVLMNHSPAVRRVAEALEAALDNEAVDMAVAMKKAGRLAMGQILGIMVDEDAKPDVRLKAAVDLADRSPETSKVQKHQVEGFMLGSDDIASLASAIVAGRVAEASFGLEVKEGFNRLPSTESAAEPKSDEALG